MSKHYIRLNTDNNIVKGFSDDFEEPLDSDICINEDGGRHFELFGIVNPSLIDNNIYRYKYINNMITIQETTPDLDSYKTSKIKLLSDECYQRTIVGIDFEWNGETKHYSLTLGDQAKLSKMYTDVVMGKQQVVWHADGEECSVWEDEKFLVFYDDAFDFIRKTELIFNSGLRLQVARCTTPEQVDSISWESKLDDDIQANLDTLIQTLR